MPQNKSRKSNQKEAGTQPESTSLEPVASPIPALIEGAKTQVVYYKPQEDEEVPKRSFTRWLYFRSQIILSILTFGVLIFYAVQWLEYRSTRELENRAYVSAKEVRLVGDTNNPELNNLFVSCINAGRTPGKNGNVVATLERREGSPPEDTVMNPPEGAPSKILFNPQIEIFQGIGVMSAVHVEAIQGQAAKDSKASGSNPAPGISPALPNPLIPPRIPGGDNRMWYIYGVITYEDIFGHPHRTKFCFKNTPLTAIWGYCPTYNDSN